MRKYTQIKEYERKQIYEGLKQGKGVRRIGEEIGRDKGTISREIVRNGDDIGYLYPGDAQKRTDKRKAKHGSKIEREGNEQLKEYVFEKLQCGWSPVIIAGCWNKKKEKTTISAEAIYQYVYHKKNEKLGFSKLLPRAKKKRGIKRRKQRSIGGIAHRVPIEMRSQEINNRQQSGHFEADLMFNKGSMSHNVLTIVERKSRMVFLMKHDSKNSKIIINSIKKRIGKFALSCTFDNGTEFALHHSLNCKTFFCRPGAPWQKGSVENMNGLLRKYLPFTLESTNITQQYLNEIEYTLNHKPRKILGFLTPHEAFTRNLDRESRVKPALPAVEVFYQNF